MNLNPTINTLGRDDQSWLGSAHGTNSARSITLAISAFTKATHYPNGYLPSGLPLGKYTSGANSGLFGPYTVGASDGSQTLAGFLFTATATDGTSNPNGALLDHGKVIVANLPISVDATAQGTNSHIIYV
jgi:hypothetical protein